MNFLANLGFTGKYRYRVNIGIESGYPKHRYTLFTSIDVKRVVTGILQD